MEFDSGKMEFDSMKMKFDSTESEQGFDFR